MKKGFTLIELLAVIVILAIIALIATPIILNIINDAREEANKRSVELYADAIKNSIVKYQLNGAGIVTGSLATTDGKTFKGTDFTVEYTGANVICDTVEIYEDGTIYLANCKVDNEEVDYTYGTKQEIGLCAFANVGVKGKIGAKYICNLGSGIESKGLAFYILEEANEKGNVALIYEKNFDNTEQPWCTLSDASGCTSTTNLQFTLSTILYNNWPLAKNVTLPTYDQLYSATGNSTSLPSWLVGNYWTSTPYGSFYAYSVNNRDIIETNAVAGPSLGVRPVITISTSDI